MKIINIKGGLGNQMFQYAYGRKLEIDGEKIIFGTFFLEEGKAKKDTARDFKLDKFNIETKAEFSKKKFYLSNFLNKILNRLNFNDNGYWQSERYFKNIEDDIRREFKLKKTLSQKSLIWQEKINFTNNSVFLHIRRGDYVQDKNTNAFHGTCDMKYYEEALKKMTELIKKPTLDIFIFSDDIDWARENLNFPHQLYFVSDPSIPDYEEMYLMSLCQYNIIANSTFSWWSAWLNNNKNKVVIGPKQWRVNKTAAELDILPKTWLQI